MILGDFNFEKVWPNNTTPVAPDGVGTVARNVGGLLVSNVAGSVRYVRLFNSATSPVMGTATAAIVIPVPVGTLYVPYPRPPLFQQGLWVSVTAGQADNDNTSPSSGDVLLNVLYQ